MSEAFRPLLLPQGAEAEEPRPDRPEAAAAPPMMPPKPKTPLSSAMTHIVSSAS